MYFLTFETFSGIILLFIKHLSRFSSSIKSFRIRTTTMISGRRDYRWGFVGGIIKEWEPKLILIDVSIETSCRRLWTVRRRAKKIKAIVVVVVSQQYALAKKKSLKGFFRSSHMVIVKSDNSKWGLACSFVFYKKAYDMFFCCQRFSY